MTMIMNDYDCCGGITCSDLNETQDLNEEKLIKKHTRSSHS